MHLTEILLTLAIAAFCLSYLMPSASLEARRSLIAWLCLALLVLNILVGEYRWQVVPIYLAFGALALGLLKRKPTNRFLKALGITSISLLIVAGVFLTTQFPIVNIPEPTGEYAVGVLNYPLIDDSRTEIHSPGEPRRISVKAYYPVNPDEADGYPVEAFWSDMHKGGNDPLGLFFGYLDKIDSNSHMGAPISRNEQFPLLVFNPGGALFTADQNTLIVEDLVSHGYVVIAIGHPYENRTTFSDVGTIRMSTDLPEATALDDPQPPGMLDIFFGNMQLWPSVWGTRDRELFNTINQILRDFMDAETHAKRQAIVEAAISSGSLNSLGEGVTPRAMIDVLILMTHLTRSNQIWLADTQYVLDNISALNELESGFTEYVDHRDLGIFGMSQGGSVAAEFCKIDERCIAGANLDGTEYHLAWDRPVPKPFLKFHHEDSPDNDFSLLPSIADFYHLTVKDTVHMDFIDVSYFLPVLSTLGMSGGIDGERMHQLLSSILLDFFNAYIKQSPADLDFSRFPEITESDLN